MKAKALKSEDISNDLFLSKEQFKNIKDKFHRELFDFYDKRNFGEKLMHKNYLRTKIKNSSCHYTCTSEMFSNILINKFPLGLI